MKRLTWMMGTLALAAIAACASKDDGKTDDSKPNDGNEVEPYQPKGSGERTSEADACERMTEALDNRASDLGCVVTYPPCPNFLRQSTGGACYEYDDGTIASCVDFIGKYQDCDDFRRRPCLIGYFADSVCEATDGGADDAGDDAADDADSGAEADAESDA